MSIPNFPFSAQGHRLRNNVFDAPACGQTYPNVVSNRFATAPTVNAKDPSGPSGTRKQTRISSGSGSAKHKSAVIGALAYLKQNVQPQQPQQTTMQLQQTSAHTQLRSWKRVEPEWRPNTSRRTHRATPPEWGPNISLLDMLQDPETGMFGWERRSNLSQITRHPPSVFCHFAVSLPSQPQTNTPLL